MKKFIKILLIAAAALIALGIILSVVGLVCGAKPLSMVSGGLWNVTLSKPSNHDYSADGVYQVSPDRIRELSIDWLDGHVVVEPYDGTEIQITETASTPLTEQNSLRYKVEHGELTISCLAPSVGISFSSIHNVGEKDLHVQIPASLAKSLDSLDFDAQNATLDVSDLQLRELSISTLDGDISVQNVQADSVDFSTQNGALLLEHTTLGDVEISGLDGDVTAKASTIRELSLDVMNGDLVADLLQCPDEVEINSLDGSVLLTLPADSQFTAHWDGLTPNAYRSQFQGSYGDRTHIVGNGRCEIDMDTMNGTLEINPAA